MCFCFVLFVLLPVSLDCPFFISPSVFSNVYFQHYFSYIAAVGFIDDVPDRKITNLPPFADELEHVDGIEYMSAQEVV